MKLILVAAICAFVFLICFLIDTLFKLIFPKSRLEKRLSARREGAR